MHTSPRARLNLRFRKLVFLLPIALPGGIVLSSRLSYHFGRAARAPWLTMIPIEFGVLGCVVLTIFISARATTRLLRIRGTSHKAMVVPAMFGGILVFGAYAVSAYAFARFVDWLMSIAFE